MNYLLSFCKESKVQKDSIVTISPETSEKFAFIEEIFSDNKKRTIFSFQINELINFSSINNQNKNFEKLFVLFPFDINNLLEDKRSLAKIESCTRSYKSFNDFVSACDKISNNLIEYTYAITIRNSKEECENIVSQLLYLLNSMDMEKVYLLFSFVMINSKTGKISKFSTQKRHIFEAIEKKQNQKIFYENILGKHCIIIVLHIEKQQLNKQIIHFCYDKFMIENIINSLDFNIEEIAEGLFKFLYTEFFV